MREIGQVRPPVLHLGFHLIGSIRRPLENRVDAYAEADGAEYSAAASGTVIRMC